MHALSNEGCLLIEYQKGNTTGPLPSLNILQAIGIKNSLLHQSL